ncbi:PilZ domain-containing protein [Altererythrobacter sp. Z27]|uniref:PilZ domain-containing protein n=1 Tax=Altererythrobacter sp. Z27 TaxID=3461147 RepID=UPI004044079A
MQTDHAEPAEQRSAQRYSLLIRPAKLLSPQGEFVCILRDVSSTGVSTRLFHSLPACTNYTLELQSGQTYEMARVWVREQEAGFEFTSQVDVDRLVTEASEFPKRGLRLALQFPITVTAGVTRSMAVVENISQQGARFECKDLLALDQNVRLEGDGLRETRAKVRWRRGTQYGVVFDDTFSLRDFALLAARLQAPGLLD